MKKTTLEWMETFLGRGSVFEPDALDIIDSDARQRATIRDLRARLAVCRVLMLQMGEQGLAADDVDWTCIRATDLKNKNWRKP